MDADLKRAIEESLRMSNAQQEAALAMPGARVEGGVIIPPDVGDSSDLSALEAEYANGPRAELWAAKLRTLGRRYRAMRRVRGDGNCFYRSLWMGYMERLCGLGADEQRRFWAEVVPQCTSSMVAHLPDEQRRAEFADLGEKFAASVRAIVEAAAPAEALVHAARRTAESRGLLRWLRLLTSARIRSEADLYEHVAMGAADLHTWCDLEVEQMEVEADEPQVQALSTALGIAVRVEYLDSKAVTWSARAGPHRHVVCGAQGSEVRARVRARVRVRHRLWCPGTSPGQWGVDKSWGGTGLASASASASDTARLDLT